MPLSWNTTRSRFMSPSSYFSRVISLVGVIILLCTLGVYLDIGHNPASATRDTPYRQYSDNSLFLQISPAFVQTRVLEGTKLKKPVPLRETWRSTKISMISDHCALVDRADALKTIFYHKFLHTHLSLDRPPPFSSL